jgi:Sodium:neurotransmitter symporter family
MRAVSFADTLASLSLCVCYRHYRREVSLDLYFIYCSFIMADVQVLHQKPVRTATFGSETVEEANGRERWSSRPAFYLAAIGSAIGFGNVWRFPALAKDYGGAAFFVPYLLAVLVVGVPIMFLEVAMGQVYQTGNVGLYGKFNHRFRGVGVACCFCAFVLGTYYCMLLSWVIRGKLWSLVCTFV